MRLTAGAVYQASDLNRKGRAILNDARQGVARVRDTDGQSLVMTSETRLGQLEADVDQLRKLADAAASWLNLEAVVAHKGIAPDLSSFGSWTWLRHLPAEDLPEFIAEVREALFTSFRELSSEPLFEAVDAWKETAISLSNPVTREILLGGSGDDDFIEVDRPEAEDGSGASDPESGYSGKSLPVAEAAG